ncbi:MAG: acetylornithine aminotransferase 2, ornithine-oxo-acid transaminase [Candidatus Peregrinibacteria bacterium GW2011_GWF2_38_29]|nr:MAG: acetylornithine aminotransferase 2, ornithine-oxo-acid transaminase [Candidatus Peregrinibacteria bacterium GW2011_GWF2_38_29]
MENIDGAIYRLKDLGRLALGRGEIAVEEMASFISWLVRDSQISADELEKMESGGVVKNYNPPNIFIERAEGDFIYGKNGRQWADFQSAYSANNLGNRNARITGAANWAQAMSSVLSRARKSPQLALLGGEITRLFGPNYKMLPMNSGCEASEGACILAKLAFNRHPRFEERRNKMREKGVTPKVIFAKRNFHGRSFWAKATSSSPEYKDPFAPLTMEQEMRMVEFGNIDDIKEALKDDDVYAIMLEPIQGEGGVNVPPENYLKQVRQLCDEHNVLLVLDEVQCGLGRAGALLAQHNFGVEADFTALGKSLSGGILPASMVLMKKEYGDLIRPGEHGSTFGGSPIACAIMRASLKEMEDRRLRDASRENGGFFIEQLREVCKDLPYVKEVRGMGLMIGIEVTALDTENICQKFRESSFVYRGKKIEGVWTNSTHSGKNTVIRVTPPLTMDRGLLRASVYAFAKALGHKNPEKFRAYDLEKPETISERISSVTKGVQYYARRILNH